MGSILIYEPVSTDYVEEPQAGYSELGEVTCPGCNGVGSVLDTSNPETYFPNYESDVCEDCRGWGIVKVPLALQTWPVHDPPKL